MRIVKEIVINKGKLKDDEIIIPKEAHLLVATGAALDSLDEKPFSNEELAQKIQNLKVSKDNTTSPIEPLFKDYKEYEEFRKIQGNFRSA